MLMSLMYRLYCVVVCDIAPVVYCALALRLWSFYFKFEFGLHVCAHDGLTTPLLYLHGMLTCRERNVYLIRTYSTHAH